MIEPDLLYPLLPWGDVQRFAAVPAKFSPLRPGPRPRATGIAEAVIRERFPRTLEYLRTVSRPIRVREAYRRNQAGGGVYSMYNVGPYTRHARQSGLAAEDRQINAAVAEPWDHPVLGRRPWIPQETCVLVACESAAEAHYVCAVLNSAIVNCRVAAHSVRGGKSFGTPGMLKYLPLRRFQPDDPRHAELASLSRGEIPPPCHQEKAFRIQSRKSSTASMC